MFIFKYLIQPENQIKTLVSNQLFTHIKPCYGTDNAISWIKIKSPGDDYCCHVVFNDKYKVTFENKKI